MEKDDIEFIQVEGEDCVYLYDDIYSGLVGKWKAGLLLKS